MLYAYLRASFDDISRKVVCMGRQLLFVICSWKVGNSNIPAMTHVIVDLAFSLTSVLMLGTHMRFHPGHEYLTGHIST